MINVHVNAIEDRMRVSTKVRKSENFPPDFLRAAINLGRELYRASVAGNPRTVFLTAPTRDFLSVSIALGAAQSALSSGQRAAPAPEVGDNVIALLANGEFYVAKFEGEERDSSTVGRMRTRLSLRGNQRISVYSDAITVLGHPRGADAQVGLSTFGSKNTAPPQVASALAAFGLNTARDLYLPVPAAVIVGTKSWTEDDLNDFTFAIDGETEGVTSLDQILLASTARILPPLVDVQPYTSNSLQDFRSPVTILDGANVPLRHGLDIGQSSQVVVLDAATPEATLELAVSACLSRVAFYEQDPHWAPLSHPGFAATERASFLRKL